MRSQLVTSRSPIAIALLLVALAGCDGSPAAGADPSQDQAPSAAALVYRGDFVAEQLLTGELRSAASEVVIVPRLPSWETTIRFMVPDGSPVQEGDRLLELDTAPIASELENKLTLQQAAANQLLSKEAEIDGQIAQKELALTKARIALDKAEIQAAVPVDVQSRQKYEEVLLALEEARVAHEKATADLEAYRSSSRAELEAVRIELSKAEREVREARRAIEMMVLRAPATGIAVAAQNRREDRKFQEGDTVYVGAEVMEIPDLERMMVEARLSDVDDGKIKPGMAATCTLDAYPDRPYPCAIASISPVAQETGYRSLQRHFLVRSDLEETDPTLMRPGMSVKVRVRTAAREGVLLVPRAALRFAGDEALVRTSDGDLRVVLGPCNALACVLEEGPAEGTRLVASR